MIESSILVPKSNIPATGSFRKTPETAATWKQYSGRKLDRFFPVDFCQLLVLSGRNRQKSLEKIRKFSGRNTAAEKSQELPGSGC